MDQKEKVDEVILNVYPGTHSYTGENLVEIQCHGSMLIVREIIALLIKNGARNAERGEFTARAFYHGRIDLVQAEAINDMIHASSKEGKDLALLSLEGKTSQTLTPLKTRLADLLSQIEVNIDYPEYQDIEEVTTQKVLDEVNQMCFMIDHLIQDGRQGKLIKDGIKVAIVGKPNVGKSSLLNALMKEQKAIVTDIAGTTRDIVEGEILLEGLPLHLLDTAGIHESKDEVESIGIEKAKKAVEDADVVLLVIDGSKEEDKEDIELREKTKNKKRIIIYNKEDLLKDEKDEGKRNEFLSIIETQLDKMKWLITNLLKISKLDAGATEFKHEKFNIAPILEKSLKQFYVTCDVREIEIVNEINDFEFVGDENWTGEAIENIIKNCIEHTDNNGKLRFFSRMTNVYNSLFIQDNGCGITKEDLPHIFERFYHGKNSSSESVGIGLALAKTVLEKEKGDIIVNSELGKGSIFELRFYKTIV